MPQIVCSSLLAKQPVEDGGVAMTEVPTTKNEGRSNASHDLPDRSSTSLLNVGLHTPVNEGCSNASHGMPDGSTTSPPNIWLGIPVNESPSNALHDLPDRSSMSSPTIGLGTPMNEGHSNASHDSPNRSTTSLPNIGLRTPMNKGCSNASHGLPDRSTTSSPNIRLDIPKNKGRSNASHIRLCRVMREFIPATRATTHPNYKALNTEENPAKYWKKDAQRKWSTEPRRLKEWTTFTFIALCLDVFVTLLPVTFLVFGASSLSLDKRPLSKFGANIDKGSAFGPTVFPIVFAAIVARLMRGVALRCAEQGTHLGLLEQLTGSQSLASAVERTVLLRRFDIIGTIIITLWLLSPIGGQSSLRILDVTNTFITSQGQIHYFNTTSVPPGLTNFATADDYFSYIITAVLEASLMEPDSVLNSPVDQWNNLKIARLDELSPFTDAAAGNPWISINQTSHKSWSSLTGLMIQQLPANGISTFTLESTYLDISCADRTQMHVNYSRKESQVESYKHIFNSKLQFRNASDPFTNAAGSCGKGSTSSFFMDSSSHDFSTEWLPVDDYINTPVNLLYVSNLATYSMNPATLIGSVDFYNCSIGTARVESDIKCYGNSCAANRMRRSETETKSPFSMPFGPVEYENILSFLPFAMGVPHDGTVSPIDQYLLGSNKPLSAGVYPIAPDFSGITAQVFSERLTTIFNTVWQASLVASSIPLGASANLTDLNNTVFNHETYVPSGSRTTTITREISVYAANHLFTTILIVISLILQVCAIAGLILKYTATAPDILGYISTMTMENPHINVPHGGNTLDGLERARYLQKTKVQLADVNWDQVEGHLAFRNVDNESDFAKGRLSKKRLYV